MCWKFNKHVKNNPRNQREVNKTKRKSKENPNSKFDHILICVEQEPKYIICMDWNEALTPLLNSVTYGTTMWKEKKLMIHFKLTSIHWKLVVMLTELQQKFLGGLGGSSTPFRKGLLSFSLVPKTLRIFLTLNLKSYKFPKQNHSIWDSIIWLPPPPPSAVLAFSWADEFVTQ